MKNLSSFEKEIKIVFNNKSFLENVFIHRSFLNEHRNHHLPSNEKLEFLGDSVLSLVTTIYLYRHYPDLDEGNYTDIKASIVRTESLAEIGIKIKLGDYLCLSKGEELHEGRVNKNIIADCFEALIAAIFLDKNFETAYNFIIDFLFKDKLDYIVRNKLYLSPKSRLQEYTQAKYKILPEYKIVIEKGPEHQKSFTIAVYLKHKKLGLGKGASKKEAEELAAKNALEKIS
jgi:ribonuclease III